MQMLHPHLPKQEQRLMDGAHYEGDEASKVNHQRQQNDDTFTGVQRNSHQNSFDDYDQDDNQYNNNHNNNINNYEGEEYYEDDDDEMVLSTRSWPDDGDHYYYERQLWDSPFSDVQLFMKSASATQLPSMYFDEDEYLQQSQQQQQQQQQQFEEQMYAQNNYYQGNLQNSQQQQQYSSRNYLNYQEQQYINQHTHSHEDSCCSSEEDKDGFVVFDILTTRIKGLICVFWRQIEVFLRICSSMLGLQLPNHLTTSSSSQDFKVHFDHFNRCVESQKANLFTKGILAFVILQLVFEVYLYNAICITGMVTLSLETTNQIIIPPSTCTPPPFISNSIPEQSNLLELEISQRSTELSQHKLQIPYDRTVKDSSDTATRRTDSAKINSQNGLLNSLDNQNENTNNNNNIPLCETQNNKNDQIQTKDMQQCKSRMMYLLDILNNKCLLLCGLCAFILITQHVKSMLIYLNTYSLVIRTGISFLFIALVFSIPNPGQLIFNATIPMSQQAAAIISVNQLPLPTNYAITFRVFLPMIVVYYSIEHKWISISLLAFTLTYSPVVICESHRINHSVAIFLSLISFTILVWRVHVKSLHRQEHFLNETYRKTQEYNRKALEFIQSEVNVQDGKQKSNSNNNNNNHSLNALVQISANLTELLQEKQLEDKKGDTINILMSIFKGYLNPIINTINPEKLATSNQN